MQLKHHEFWHPRLFETPYYLYLLAQCVLRGISPKSLAKANYALDHGELGLGSKFSTQMAFDQSKFLPTTLIKTADTCAARESQFIHFAQEHGYPLILKPDIGAVGKGIEKIYDQATALARLRALKTDHLLQVFTPHPVEFGVFFVRSKGISRITGMNQKHFPSVIGDGKSTISQLAQKHERFTAHWPIFLKYINTEEIPAQGEEKQLSFIGSHTMGCKFTDDTHLVTDALRDAIFAICESQPGFNFGRFDVKSESVEALLDGEFYVIEVNGVASLPTHMFDPDGSVLGAYRIFLNHGKLLAKIAEEQRHKSMHLDSLRHILERAKHNARLLDEVHEHARSPNPKV